MTKWINRNWWIFKQAHRNVVSKNTQHKNDRKGWVFHIEAVNFSVSVKERSFRQNSDIYNRLSDRGIDLWTFCITDPTVLCCYSNNTSWSKRFRLNYYGNIKMHSISNRKYWPPRLRCSFRCAVCSTGFEFQSRYIALRNQRGKSSCLSWCSVAAFCMSEIKGKKSHLKWRSSVQFFISHL